VNWYRFGGRILFFRDEQTRQIRIRYIPPHPSIRGLFQSSDEPSYPNGGRLTKDQVEALPEIEFDPFIHGKTHDLLAMEAQVTNAEHQSNMTDACATHVSPQQFSPPSPPSSCMPMGTCCSVCLEDFDCGEKVRMLPCSHLYHLDCILPWLTERQGVCPLCKQHVLYQDPRTTRFTDDESPHQNEAENITENVQSADISFGTEGDGEREVRERVESLNISYGDEGMNSNEQNSSLGNADESEEERSIHNEVDQDEGSSQVHCHEEDTNPLQYSHLRNEDSHGNMEGDEGENDD